MFASKVRSLPRVECPKGASPGKALALITKTLLGWEGFLRENSLAYYEISI